MRYLIPHSRYCLRFAPALPLRGIPLRGNGLHEAEAAARHNTPTTTTLNTTPLTTITGL